MLLFILLAYGCTLSAAESVSYDGLRFTILPDLSNRNFFGYNFLRVLVTNKSGRPRQVTFSMQADYSRDLDGISRSFAIQADETREEALIFPMADFSSPGLEVEVDGTKLAQNLQQYFRIYRNYYGKAQALVDTKIARNSFESVFGQTGPYNRLNLEMNQFDGSVSQLYHNWLGYSQFNLVIYHAITIDEMPEPVKTAIYDYVRAGGSLLVIGKVRLPADFAVTSASEEVTSVSGGFGRVLMIRGAFFPTEAQSSLPGSSEEQSSDLLPETEGSLDSLGPPAAPAYDVKICNLFSNSTLKHVSPLVFKDEEISTLSARWLMLVIYLFAFIIGPVNVYVLYRMGRRIMVFLTVPIASIACCGFIYFYYLVFESSTLLIKRQTMTLLDERESRAITLGNYSVFSARSRPEGLHFDMQTEVYNFNRDDYRSSDGGKLLVLDEDQHLAAGWIKPRVPRYLHLRSIQTRRERLTLSYHDGRLQVMNGLGGDIVKISLMTSAGRIYTGADLAAGQTASLDQAGSIAQPQTGPIGADMIDNLWYRRMDNIEDYFDDYLRPGTYIATVRNSPFLRQQLEAEAQVEEKTVIIGILREEPEA